MLSPGPGKKHSICLGNAACVWGHFVRECTKSRPSNTPTGNEIPNVIHTRSLMSIETSSFCNASIPRREGEPYLGGRWPSISNFSQFISLPKSNRTMMSGINQTLTPHIQDWDMYPFLSAQICLLSCWGSLAADLSPFFFSFFFLYSRSPASDSWRIVHGKCRDHPLKNPKRRHAQNSCTSATSLQFYSH